ncbi:MAG: Ig-like domain-containing protein, partial [Opitutales bacterium]|nr:Ig-like domain-containing protein [Opitutales bacterium]
MKSASAFLTASVRKCFHLALVGFACSGLGLLSADQVTPQVRVEYAPQISGRVESDIQQMRADGFWLNSGAVIEGTWFVPGTPRLTINGRPDFGGVIEGNGSPSPSGYGVGINQGVSLTNLGNRTDSEPMPAVSAPPSPAGRRKVTIDRSGQSPGDFATLRNLSLNANVGAYMIPAGAYGDFTANRGTSFVLGEEGATRPSVYAFQRLNLNAGARLELLGPVIIHLRYGGSFNGNIGREGECDWLSFLVYSGDCTLNSDSMLWGHVVAPSGQVTVNARSYLEGSVMAKRLTVNSQGVIRGCGNPFDAEECLLYPIGLSASILDGLQPGSVVSNAMQGTQPGQFGWLSWQGTTDVPSLVRSLTIPGDSYRYVNADDPSDTELSAGDWVHGNPGVSNARGVRDALDGLLGLEIILPVWSQSSGQGRGARYQVVSFARVRLLSYNLSGSHRITFRFLGYADCGTAPVEPPVVEDAAYETFASAEVEAPLLATDPAGLPLTYTITLPPSSGTLSGEAPNLRYTPADGFLGLDSFRFVASNGVYESIPATVTITVLPRNRAPVVDAGGDQSLTLDSPYTFTLSGSASDDGLPTGSTLSTTWTLLSGAGEATIAEASQLNTAVTVSTPGIYTFRLTATDGELSASDDLTVTVAQTNRAPYFTSEPVLEVAENTPYLYVATAEDPDAIYGDTLTLEAVNLPDWLTATTTATGELRLDGIPSRTEVGSHSVLLRATDSAGASVEQSFTITVLLVNQAPIAQDAAFSVVRYGNLSDALAPFASDPDGQPITFSLISDASNGSLSFSSDGSFTYSPDGSYYGTDSFTYQVSDGTLASRVATVTITVSFVNRAPVAEDLAVETLEETPVDLPLLASDADSDPLQLELLTLPASGTVEADGVVLEVGVRFPAGAVLRYVPASAFSGVAGFSFAAWDGVEASAPATVTITVLPRNRAPVVDAGEDQSLTLDSPYTFTLSGSASDDGLPAGSTLSTTWTLVSGAGEATIAEASQLNTAVTVSIPGIYTFRLTATDGELSASDEVTVTLAQSNRAPYFTSEPLLEVAENTPYLYVATAEDPDAIFGDTLTLEAITLPDWLTATTTATGELRLEGTPSRTEVGSHSVLLRATDSAGASVEQSFTITVLEVRLLSVDAGPDRELHLPQEYLTLSAQVVASHAPDVNLEWKQLSGPANVLPTANASDELTMRFRISGRYVFSISASDGVLSDEDEVVIDVISADFVYRTYTTTEDFSTGVSQNLDSGRVDEIAVSNETREFGSIWIAASGKGTVYRLDTDTGTVIGEYHSAPNGQPKNPSRTTVDYDGGVWVGNRNGSSVVHIVTPESGLWVDRNGNGVCDTSTGIGDVRAWSNAGAADTLGGVSTAEDECIVHYVRTSTSGVRHVSVDRFNDVWVKGHGGAYFDHIDGSTGAVISKHGPNGYGGYGGLIDARGVIWSSSNGSVLRWDTSLPLAGPQGENWSLLPGGNQYGVGIDPMGNVVAATYGGTVVYKYSPDGSLWGTLTQGNPNGRGIAADKDGTIWVAHSSTGTVGRIAANGTFIGNVDVGGDPIGVSVDHKNRPWVVTTYHAIRIDPDGGSVGMDGETNIGLVDLVVPLSGSLYNYSDMTGLGIASSPPNGRWTTVFDSEITDAQWSQISWNAMTCGDGEISVHVSSSDDGIEYGEVQVAQNGDMLEVPSGRFLKLEVRMIRSIDGHSPVLRDLTVGTVGYSPLPVVDSPVIVDAGKDLHVNWRKPLHLIGAVWNDGLPLGYSPTANWEQISGPQLATLETPNQQSTWVWFDRPGDYEFRLTGEDNHGVYSDTVLVSAGGPPGEPVLNAFTPTPILRNPGLVQLFCDVRFTNTENPPEISLKWEQLSGPSVDFGSVDLSNHDIDVVLPARGLYLFRVTVDGWTRPKVALVEVRVDLGYDPELPEDIAAWWPGNGNAIEVYSGQPAQTLNRAAYAPGMVSQAFDFDGVDDYRLAKARPSYAIGSRPESPGASIEFWVSRGVLNDAEVLRWSDKMRLGFGGSWFTAQWSDGVNSPYVNWMGFSELNRWYHVVCTYDKASGMARLWVDGVQRTEKNIGTFDLATTGDIQIGSPQFKGQLDEVTLYDRALTPEEITALYESGEMGKPPFSDNLAPVVNAGADQVATVENGAILQGQASDDGKPVNLGLTTLWSLLSGPEGSAIAEPTALQSEVTFTQPGIYVFELSAADGMYVSRDTVEVRVDLGYDQELPEDIAAWWPGNGNATEVYSGQVAQTFNGAGYAAGMVSQAFDFDGVDDYRLAKARPSYAVGSRPESSGASIEFWVSRGVLNDAEVLRWSDKMRLGFGGSWFTAQWSDGVNSPYV